MGKDSQTSTPFGTFSTPRVCTPHKPLPPPRTTIKQEGEDNFNVTVELLEKCVRITFMQLAEPPSEILFEEWLKRLQKIIKPIHLVFTQGALKTFTEQMLVIWLRSCPAVDSARFDNPLKEEVNPIAQILRGVAKTLRAVDFHDSVNLSHDDWMTLSRTCRSLTAGNFSNCKGMTEAAVIEILINNRPLDKLRIAGLNLAGRLTQLFRIINEHERSTLKLLDLSGSDLFDKDLIEAGKINNNLLTLALRGCSTVTGAGVADFLLNWEFAEGLELDRLNINHNLLVQILNQGKLTNLSLVQVNGVSDAVFNESSLKICRLSFLNLQETIVTVQGVRVLLTHVKSLKTLNIRGCPIKPVELLLLQKDFPNVELISEHLPQREGDYILNFKKYMACQFPSARVRHQAEQNRWEIELIPEENKETPLWQACLNSFFPALMQCDIRLTFKDGDCSMLCQDMPLLHFVKTIAPVVREIALKELFYLPVPLPHLRRLELENGCLSRIAVEKMVAPALESLFLNRVSVDSTAFMQCDTQFPNLKEYTIQSLPQRDPWVTIAALHTLPSISTWSFDIPTVPLENVTDQEKLSIALWNNQSNREISQKIAKSLFDRLSPKFDLAYFKNALETHFTDVIVKMIGLWNQEDGELLTLSYKNGKLTGKLHFSPQLKLSSTQSSALLDLVKTIPFNLHVEDSTGISFVSSQDFRDLAKTLSPHVTSFSWSRSHTPTEEKSKKPLPVLHGRPFLEEARKLNSLELKNISLEQAGLSELFRQPGILKRLSLAHCESLSSKEIRSWEVWAKSVEDLTLCDCTFTDQKTLEALIETFKSLTNLNLEGFKTVNNAWFHLLADIYPELKQLNVKDTSIGKDCFATNRPLFPHLELLNIAQSPSKEGISDKGLAITDEFITQIAFQSPRVMALNISGCYISGAGFTKKMPFLTTLYWKDCPVVTLKGLHFLVEAAPNLKTLDLRGSSQHDLQDLEFILKNANSLEKIIVEGVEERIVKIPNSHKAIDIKLAPSQATPQNNSMQR